MKRARNHKATWPVRLISLMIMLLSISITASSQGPESQAARDYAADFFSSWQFKKTGLKSAVSASSLTQTYQSPTDVNTPLFVFQQAENAFAIVARSHNTYKVVGYSDEGAFQAENIPPPLRELMTYYEDSLQFMNLVSAPMLAGTPIVPALLYEHNIRLNQFNHAEVGGSVSGCMATAIAQILLFHAAEQNTQIKGYGSHCYTYEPWGELCADFENTTYNSDELLSYHVAIALDMRFTTAGSSPPSMAVMDNIEEYFHFFVKNTINENFYLKNELEHRRPVYAGLTGFPENHAVVIDGYDDRDYFHLNFGWGGTFNGYFLMNNGVWFGTGNGGQKFNANFSNIYLFSPSVLPVNPQDSLALIAVNEALGGYEATRWDTSKPVWTWPGVLVMNDRVIRLTLAPSIPPATAQSIAPEIGNLTALQELNLYGCFNGTIPSTIANLSDLKTLNITNKELFIEPTLHKGNLKGTLPANIDNLSKLEWLMLSNVLEGTLPASIGNLSNLKILRLSQDTTQFGVGKVTGSIPEEIGTLGQLQQLQISNQQLSGNLPSTITNLSGLTELDLSGNQLSGSVPAMSLPQLGYLRLNDNLFSEMADGNGSCPNLKYLELQNNQISGSIPWYLGNFTALEYLNLSDNQIEALPAEMGNLNQLERLDINNNLLTTLPGGLAIILNLKHLSAHHNTLNNIPGNLGQSRSLETLDLSYNQITTIPEEIGNCPNLYQIYLNNNKITRIPATFENIRDEATVLLDDNEMTGSIPEKLMMSGSQNNKFVRLDGNRFVFNDIPASNELRFGVRNQKEVRVKKQLYLVQPGDTVSIDVRSLSNLSNPDNEYYWFTYPEYATQTVKDEQMEDLASNPVLQFIVNEGNVNNQYYCKVFNSNVPSFWFDYNGSTITTPCMDYLNTETIGFKMATDEEIIAEKYPDEYVTSLAATADKSIADGTVTLVPPIKIKRGLVQWEASADGVTWEQVSETMERADLQANVKSVSTQNLILAPRNTAYYRCSILETDCDPLYSDKLKVNALGNVLFDEIINVTEETKTISVDSIEIVVPINFHESDFRLTITKLENPPAAPDSVTSSTAYDVNVSFGSVFDIPLLIKFKNVDVNTFDKMDVNKYKAAYYNDINQKWELYGSSGISLKDSTIEFFTNHLTKLAWFELAHGSFTHIHTRDHVNIIYKGDADWTSFTAYELVVKKMAPEPWRNSNTDPDNGGTPFMIQDMGEYMDQIIDKFKSLGLQTPGLRFNVYVDSQQKHAGQLGFCGYMAGRGYFYINPMYTTDPDDVRRTLAHEYMHYTQDYYMTVTLQNYWWQEAHAPLSDRLVWDDQIQEVAEPEYLLKAGRTPSNDGKSIFDILSDSWYDDNNIPLFSKSFTNSNDPNLASTFLHYMRSYRMGAKLRPDVLLKETSYFGTWVNYLDGYIKTYLNSTIGDEYEDFVKYILSGDTINYTIINKNGNPYSYVQHPKNIGVFTFPVSYSFKEGDEIPQKDEMEIKVPYTAAKIVLLENLCPDTLVLVNYKRNHNSDDNHLVYHATYDYEKKEMTYVNISDSTGYNFLLDARSKENILTKFSNYSFLLLINKNSVSTDFDASFELTATPILNIENVGLLSIYDGASPLQHTFDKGKEYISMGSPDAAYLQNVTEFKVEMVNNSTTKQIINNQTYQTQTQYTLIIDQGFTKGMPTIKDSTIFTQTIEHDIVSGTLKITEQETKVHKYHTYIEFVDGPDGDVEERLVFNGYTGSIKDFTKTYWLKDIIDYIQPALSGSGMDTSYGKNSLTFKTSNTAETQSVVSKIDGNIKTTQFNASGGVTSTEESTYLSTDYSNPNLYLYFVIRTGED